MVREAQRAGLHFDPVKLRSMQCAPEEHHDKKNAINVPTIVEPDTEAKVGEKTTAGPSNEVNADGVSLADLPLFHRKIHHAATKGTMHDMLSKDPEKGYGLGSMAWWLFMEYLPLRRMDLQPDGSWKPIAWPLPMGETRDIPDNVVIHNSVIRRMVADKTVRPGNLIVGGGGRGVRVAPEDYGLGEWKVLREEGDIVGEVWVRDGKPVPGRLLSKSSTVKTNGSNHEVPAA
jgi:hypothetical protein